MKRAWLCLVFPALLAVASTLPAAEADSLKRELLRQGGAAERSLCDKIRAVLAGRADAALTVRTAVELGYNPCQVVRCALEAGADLAKVIQGAASAGVREDVISRCAVEGGADPGTVAALFAEILLDTNFCYFGFRPPEGLVPAPPVIERGYRPPQASPFSF